MICIIDCNVIDTFVRSKFLIARTRVGKIGRAHEESVEMLDVDYDRSRYDDFYL